MMKICDCRRGQVLFAALLVAVFLGTLGISFLSLAVYDEQNAYRRNRRALAMQIAQAGIEKVCYWFNNPAKAPAVFYDSLGGAHWATAYRFIWPDEDGYHDNDDDGTFSAGDVLKSAAEDQYHHDFNGDDVYDNLLSLLEKNKTDDDPWKPDVRIVTNRDTAHEIMNVDPVHELPSFPYGKITDLIIYAPPAGETISMRNVATVFCVAVAGDPAQGEKYAKVMLKVVIRRFKPIDPIKGAVNVKGTADFSAQSNIHWGDALIGRRPGNEPDLDFGTVEISSKVDKYHQDPWADYHCEGDMLTKEAFTSIDYRTWDIEQYDSTESQTPLPEDADFYQLHRWATDVYNDADGDGEWDAGTWADGVVWDIGLDGTALSNDRGEGNGIYETEPFVDANGDGAFNAGDREPYWDFNRNGQYDGPAGLGNGVYDGPEPYTDVNGNGVYDTGEPYADSNGNGRYDVGETFEDKDEFPLQRDANDPYKDVNLNGLYDPGEPFIDRGDGVFNPLTEGPFHTDVNEAYIDANHNGQYDPGEPFKDVVDGAYSPGEPYVDVNGNGAYDPAEPFTDVNGNGAYDDAEPYTDVNGSGTYDAGEPFTDVNGNGSYDGAEPYTDSNGNGSYDPAEPFTDMPDGKYTGQLEPFADVGIDGVDAYEGGADLGDLNSPYRDDGEANGVYDPGEPFTDVNGNGIWGYYAEPYWDTNLNGICDGTTGEGFYDLNFETAVAGSTGVRNAEPAGTSAASEIYDDRVGAVGESFTDGNNNGYYERFEVFTDSNKDRIRNANQVFDGGERFVDLNMNLKFDMEPFTDFNGNGKYDVMARPGEDFDDWNGNGVFDENAGPEPLIDTNGNEVWDAGVRGEDFVDLNGNGQWDEDGGPAEPFTDSNGNGVWDPDEPYTDEDGDGTHDPGEPFVDINDNGQWDAAEPFTDENGNGSWDSSSPEPFTDENGNTVYDATGLDEIYVDTYPNGQWDSQISEPPSPDLNGNGKWDNALDEEFLDVGLDGVAGTGDYGEGNGVYDIEPFIDDGVDGIGGTPAGWAGNGKCDGDPWIDANMDGLLNGEAVFDKNRNYRADKHLPFPKAYYEKLKDLAKEMGTYYYADNAGNIRNQHGAIVNFKSEWENSTGLYFVDTTDQQKPKDDLSNCNFTYKVSGEFFTSASLYFAGNLNFEGLGSGEQIYAKNPGELRHDANNTGAYEAPKDAAGNPDEWTSTVTRPDGSTYDVYHAGNNEIYHDANGNGVYDYGEWFIDANGNGECDLEEYIDDVNVNDVCDDQSNWRPNDPFRIGPYTDLGGKITVHIDGFVYVVGQFNGGGNCIIYGAALAENGFAVGGTPDVYYNVDLGFGLWPWGVTFRVCSWECVSR